jgi:N-acetyl-alpha-D-muramate 1-phosphate uridylyltransferase
MTRYPTTAMLLAAGLGVRMRPLTNEIPKPLLPLGGRALIDHALDRLAEAGVRTAVTNAFWQPERLEAHLTTRENPRVIIRREAELLDTGGGVHAALDLLGSEPFYVVNGDAFWLDGPHPTLARLARAFDPSSLDVVLLVHRTTQIQADVGSGDFAMDKWGRLRRRGEREIVPYLYAGLQIVSPALFANAPAGAFSMNLLWNRAIAADRLRAVVHDGLWFHLSTPADLAETESALQMRLAAETR